MHTRLRTTLLALLAVPLALVGGCAQQPATGEASTEAAASGGLVPRKTGLDSVSAAYAFDMSGAKVYLEPVRIEYTKQFRKPDLLRAKAYELDGRDLQKLQDVMAQTLSERFLAPRQSQLVSSRAEADYVMQLDLSRFSLGAPLDPSPWVWRVYTDQAAYGVLSGELRDRGGNTVMRFSDRRDIGENFGGPGVDGRFEQFNSVTFWSDIKVDMRRAFASLDQSLR